MCRGREYTIGPGDILLFQPGDNHACEQRSGELDYRAINISGETMQNLAQEVTGSSQLPGFSQCVIKDSELGVYLRALHQMMMEGSREFEKEENFLLMITLLLTRYGKSFADCLPKCQKEIEKTCSFIRENYARHVSLEDLCGFAGLSKSTLLRAFTREKGVTPYRYLQNIRVSEAKKLLEQGCSSIDAAMKTGFSDQSHFTKAFRMFIGLSPGSYREIFTNQKKETEEKQYEK